MLLHLHTSAMGYRNFFCFIVDILICISLTAAQICNNTGNFTTNSTYAKNRNRNLILSSLASNVTANGGFYNTTIGQEPDKVYLLVLCRGDASEIACSSCVNATSQAIIAKCPNQKEAITWGSQNPPCIVRYADRSIIGKMELFPGRRRCNPNNISSDLIQQFDQVWGSLVTQIVTGASMGSSKLKFATREAEFTNFQKIYSLGQCTPDISQSDCSYCLQECVSAFQRYCPGRQGGFIKKPSCFFRWALSPFYDSAADAPHQSPPSPPINPPPTIETVAKDNGSFASKTVLITIIPSVIFLLVVAFMYILFCRRKPQQLLKNRDEISTVESLQFHFGTVRVATDNFSDDNKLGQGGFGAVYKGTLPDGQAIAVKRLSRNSRQGEVEFKNEILLVAKLQHKNLVRLLGFCLEGKERLLIYEFLPNSSLDHLIFDSNKRLLLDWKMSYKIIVGIARGILYLHEDSRLRIIHRDLKASNILLDDEMNPKISDFGTARLFAMHQSQDTTTKIVGTLGYMPPEYVIHGQFSVKSDVFSFGVIILEIITGQKVSCFTVGDMVESLLTYAWRSWNEGKAINLIDPNQLRVGSKREIMRCIHIGLLCVQENVVRRPTMASVVMMLSSRCVSLPLPSKPAYFMHSTVKQEASCNLEATMLDQSKSGTIQVSVNEASISELYPR